MKGMPGIIIAVALGLTGAMLNYAYLARKSRDVEKVYFIGIKPEVTVTRGDRLVEENLVPVGIPRENVGSLNDFAVRFEKRDAVLGMNVSRTLPGGSLLLEEDLKTPPQTLDFGKQTAEGVEERAMWIPVDTKTFVPSLVTPGDQVSFVFPRSRIGSPTPAAGADSAANRPAGSNDIIGPFKILSLGNRLGSSEVLRAAKIPQVQENVMTISVTVRNGQLEPKAEKLLTLLRATNFRQVSILLHPRDR